MPSCNEMEAHVGVALAHMESAKARLIEVFRHVSRPGFHKSEQLRDLVAGIYMAELELNAASIEAERLQGKVAAMIEAQEKSA